MDQTIFSQQTVRPATDDELCSLIVAKALTREKLQIRGGASKDEIGAPIKDATIVDMREFHGILDYDPEELVLTAGAGTTLAEIQAAVAAEGQTLAFDPFDHGILFSKGLGSATLGGVIAAGVSGSRRLSKGSARDHLLGFHAVSGRGERFVAGGRVVKNVTGFDLSKLMTGSWGRLAAFTQLTIKVLPRPRKEKTLQLFGLAPTTAISAMTRALGSSVNVSAARHIPPELSAAVGSERVSVTEFLIEGFPESVDARLDILSDLLKPTVGYSTRDICMFPEEHWHPLVPARDLVKSNLLWRVNILASRATDFLKELQQFNFLWWLDWGGALIWVSIEDRSEQVRNVARNWGGHATLVRAPVSVRNRIPTLTEPCQEIRLLESRIRRAFDPAGIFETGRF